MALARPLLALVLAGGAGAASASDPAEWLLRISEAARHEAYTGIVVYRDEDMMQTLRVVHRHKGGREQERLTSLNGEPRDIFREDEHVTCIVAENADHDHSLDVTAGGAKSLFPDMSRETLERVAEHYEFRELGEARVAGRVCRGVALVPRDQFRYGYRVWADAETAVPLRVSLLDHEGEVIEQMMFTEIEYPKSIPDTAFKLPPGVSGFQPPRAELREIQHDHTLENWALDRLPPGFRVAQRDIRAMAGGEGYVEHVLLSDGLSAVSVFRVRVAAPGGQKLFSGMSHMGGMHAYGRLVGRFHFTIVGEVPQATVRMIGDSFEATEVEDAPAAPARAEGGESPAEGD